MKKLKLNLDEIKVESFETSSHSFTQGTILAQGAETEGAVDTCYEYCLTQAQTCDPSCGPSCNTACGQSCIGTCPATCGVTCATCENQNTCDYSCQQTVCNYPNPF